MNWPVAIVWSLAACAPFGLMYMAGVIARERSCLAWLLIAAAYLTWSGAILIEPATRPPPAIESNLAPGSELPPLPTALQTGLVPLHQAGESAGGRDSLLAPATDVTLEGHRVQGVGHRVERSGGDGFPAGSCPAAFPVAALSAAGAPSLRPAPSALRPLLAAIRQVESAGDDRAVGDGGRSRGPYQIGLAYWRRYAPAALAAGDLATLARVHNGGPGGAGLRATLGYWRRVKVAMEAQR